MYNIKKKLSLRSRFLLIKFHFVYAYYLLKRPLLGITWIFQNTLRKNSKNAIRSFKNWKDFHLVL